MSSKKLYESGKKHWMIIKLWNKHKKTSLGKWKDLGGGWCFLLEGEPGGTTRMDCVFSISVPRLQAPAIATPCAGPRDAKMPAACPWWTLRGVARKGEGPVTRQVQLYRVNTRIRRGPGSCGSQRWCSWLLGWEGKASEEITGQTRQEGHPRQRNKGTHQYLQVMVWNVGGQAGCTRTAPLLWRLCWTLDACQRNWRPGEMWSQEVTWRHAVMSNIVAIHHRRLFKLIKIK